MARMIEAQPDLAKHYAAKTLKDRTLRSAGVDSIIIAV